tara:strand:+ start:349 stop:636 length:288 start_codon:yes stop_codon:yes gene_type:complete
MTKYLQITTGEGIQLIPIGAGLFAEQTSATALRIYSNSMGSLHHYELVTVAGTFKLVTAINAALEIASRTVWTNAVEVVALPVGETVTSITVAAF